MTLNVTNIAEIFVIIIVKIILIITSIYDSIRLQPQGVSADPRPRSVDYDAPQKLSLRLR